MKNITEIEINLLDVELLLSEHQTGTGTRSFQGSVGYWQNNQQKYKDGDSIIHRIEFQQCKHNIGRQLFQIKNRHTNRRQFISTDRIYILTSAPLQQDEPQLPSIQAIRLWERFMGDCIGIWRGTKRSFDIFVRQLKNETKKHGIEYPAAEVQFGKSLNFFALSVYLNTEVIQNLQTQSGTWTLIAFTRRLCSTPYPSHNSYAHCATTRRKKLHQPKWSFAEITLRTVAITKTPWWDYNRKQSTKQHNPQPTETHRDNSFPCTLFRWCERIERRNPQLRKRNQVTQSSQSCLRWRNGDRSGTLLYETNNSLHHNPTTPTTQKCNGTGCHQCPNIINTPKVNSQERTVPIPKTLNCKSRNVIYLWLCKLCGEEEAYFGRTTQEFRDRTSGHRSCVNDETKIEKSALSMHVKDKHENNFSLVGAPAST